MAKLRARPRHAGAGQRDVMCTLPWRRSSRTPIPSDSTLQAMRPGPEAASSTSPQHPMRKFATGAGTPRGTNPHRQSSAARGFLHETFVRLTAPETLQHVSQIVKSHRRSKADVDERLEQVRNARQQRKLLLDRSEQSHLCHVSRTSSSGVRLKRSVKKSALGFLHPAVCFDFFE